VLEGGSAFDPAHLYFIARIDVRNSGNVNRLEGKKMNKRIKSALAIPFHQFMGVTSVTSQAGIGEMAIEVTENIINPVGKFHGGALYALCDVCAYAGLASLMDDQTEAVTNDIHVSIMRTAELGDVIHFKSEIMKLGRRLCFIDVKVTCQDKLIASAKVTKSMLSVAK